jgi:hypothetical protein
MVEYVYPFLLCCGLSLVMLFGPGFAIIAHLISYNGHPSCLQWPTSYASDVIWDHTSERGTNVRLQWRKQQGVWCRKQSVLKMEKANVVSAS